MNAETWKCPKCGEEEIETQFDACWNCGTFRDGHTEPTEETDASEGYPKSVSVPAEAQFKVGCLLIFWVVVIALVFFAFVDYYVTMSRPAAW